MCKHVACDNHYEVFAAGYGRSQRITKKSEIKGTVYDTANMKVPWLISSQKENIGRGEE